MMKLFGGGKSKAEDKYLAGTATTAEGDASGGGGGNGDGSNEVKIDASSSTAGDLAANNNNIATGSGGDVGMTNRSDLGTPNDGNLDASNAAKGGGDEMNAQVKLKANNKRGQMKKKKNQFNYTGSEKDALIEAVYQVEDKLKDRELIRIKVISIDVMDLPPVHKFMKNQPYLKCSVGQENNFMLPYIPGDDGSKGTWVEIQDWDFKLERNERDRKDMIVSVCTHDLIIGRYVLLAHEFALIPQSKSGYFEVSGEILNAIGNAGRIQMTCKRYVGDRPTRPKINNKDISDVASVLGTHIVKSHAAKDIDHEINRPKDDQGRALALDEQTLADEAKINIVKGLDTLNVKFGSIAVADLPSAHLVELNSPYIVIKRGKWQKNTEAVISGGPQGKWTKLRWKLLLNRGDIIHLDVLSQNVFIGMCVVTFDDILHKFDVSNGDNKLILDFMRVLNNGTTIVGNLKIKLQISTNENLGVLFETQNQLAKQVVAQQQMKLLQDELVSQMRRRAEEGVDEDGDDYNDDNDFDAAGGGKNARSSKPLSSSPILRDIQSLAPLSPSNSLFPPTNHLKYMNSMTAEKLEPRVVIKDCPFQITLISISVFDLKQVNPLLSNSPYVTIACGSHGKTTQTLSNTANYGQWTNLDWSFTVMQPSNKLRMIVWSRGEEIGQCVIEAEKLKNQPLDYEGYTEFYVKLLGLNSDASQALSLQDDGLVDNKRKFVTGRMKFIAKYDQCDPEALFPSRKLVEANRRQAQAEKASNFGFHHRVPLSAVIYSEYLPCLVTLLSISVYDLKQIHKTDTPMDWLYYVKNSPQVKVICDRKSAITKMVDAEFYDNARWERLLWQLVVTEGSFLLVSVLSRGKMIGRVEMNAKTLVTLPKIQNNIVEFKHNIQDIDGCSTGKIQMTFRLEKVPENFDSDPTKTGFQEELGYKNKHDSNSKSPNKVKGRGQDKTKANFATPSKADLMNQSKSQMIQRFGSANLGSPSAMSSPSKASAAGGGGGRGGGDLSPPDEKDSDINIFELKKTNMAVQIRIIDIDVYELQQIHMFKDNSPFVSVQCGKFIETSKEIVGGGEIGYWSQLNWIFKLKLDNSLRVTVGSSNKMIGLSAIFPEALILNKKDASGAYRFVDLLYDGLKETGKVKLTYEMSISRDRKAVLESGKMGKKNVFIPSGTVTNTGSHIPMSATGQDFDDDDDIDNNDKERSASSPQKGANGIPDEVPFDAEDEFDLKFPMVVTFNSIILSDVYLQSKSVLAAIENAFDFKKTKKYLRVKMSVGKQSIITDASLMTVDMVQWDKFFQSLYLEHIHTEVVVSVFACSVKGGDALETGSDTAVVIIDEEKLVGGVIVTAEELCDIPRNNVGITEFAKTVSNGKYCTGLISLSCKLEPKLAPPGGDGGIPPLPSTEEAAIMFSDPLPMAEDGSKPKKTINVREEIMNKGNANVDRKQEALMQTKVAQILENVNAKLDIATGEVIVPKFKAINAAPISAKDRDIDVLRSTVGDSYGPSQKAGSRPSSARPSTAGAGGRPGSAVPRLGGGQPYMSGGEISNFIKFGYNIKISKIACIKLKSMHKLVKNSPLATFMCGNMIHATPILTNSGSSASWDQLENFHFVVHDDINLSVTLSSKGLVIGSCSFTLDQLLNETDFKQDLDPTQVPNKLRYINKESGILTIFGDLIDTDGNLTGNIKISFRAKAMN